MKTLFLFVSVMLSGSFYLSADDNKRPNIVILYADDMGVGDLAIQNPDSKIPTPNLDQLAREGMLFTDAHSSSGSCTPSRYALLTGRHHWRKFHTITSSFDHSVFDKEELLLPEMLKEKGYATACVGKWHLGFDWDSIIKDEYKKDAKELSQLKRKGLPANAVKWELKVPDGPTAHGFDYYFGDGTPNFPPYGWMENDKMLGTPTIDLYKPFPVPPEAGAQCRKGPAVEGWRLDKVMPKLTEKAVAWIDGQKDTGKPFFMYFPWTSSHTPIVPTEEFYGTSKAGPYGDFMVQSDWTAGQVIKALKRNGFYENTIIIFTADNGSAGMMVKRDSKFNHNSSGPLRGLKSDIYEGGHRVPLIISWPGVTKPGSATNALTSQVDIMTTLAKAVGYDLPEDQAEDGYDLLPVLKGGESSGRTALVMNTDKDQFGIRQNDWVLILKPKGKLDSGSAGHKEYIAKNKFETITTKYALFNLKNDLAQRQNLVEQYPEKIEELKKLLEQIKKGS